MKKSAGVVVDLIKSYINLTGMEKCLVKDFISIKKDSKKSIDEIEKMFNNKMYGYGKGSLFYFLNGRVVGKINIILEVVKELGNAFICYLEILDDIDNREIIIKELIDKAIEIANNYKSNKILLSAKDKNMLDIFENFGYKSEYRAIKMHLADNNQREKCLDLVPLSEKNKNEYLSIYNDSFSDMPHGTYIYIDEVEEYLSTANDENYYFLVSVNNTNIGFMNCIIENGQGIFDIGLCKAFRGKGNGKRLLETAIDFLNKKHVRKINLIVIEKNEVAYNMYKKRGFQEESVISHWIDVRL